jgi:hypothetical protein
MSAGRKADSAIGGETEHHPLVHLEVGVASGLGQGDPELGAGLRLAQQHGRVGAVEQQALHHPLVHGCRSRSRRQVEFGGAAAEHGHLGAHEGAGGLADARLAPSRARLGLRPDHPAVRGGDVDEIAVDGADAALDAVIGTDEPRHEGRGGRVVEFLGAADLFEAAGIHHRDLVGEHQGL